jgi:hypothetical protein
MARYGAGNEDGPMDRAPVRLLLCAADPALAALVEAILEVQAEGLVRILRQDGQEDGPTLVDVVLLLDGDALASLQQGPAGLGPPVIVVELASPALDDVHRLMGLGADDVLGLAELGPRRLLAAIVKAADRGTRHGQLRRPVGPEPAEVLSSQSILAVPFGVLVAGDVAA